MQVLALDRGQAQDARHGRRDAVGDVRVAALPQTGVVVGADPGQPGDFFPAHRRTGRQPRVLGTQPGPATPQEITQLFLLAAMTAAVVERAAPSARKARNYRSDQRK